MNSNYIHTTWINSRENTCFGTAIQSTEKYYSTVSSCQSIISFLNNDSVSNYIFTKMNDMLKERNMGTWVLIYKGTIYEINIEIKDSNL